jgi:DNA-binding response OmpR family regulator
MTLEQLPTRPPDLSRLNVVLLRWPAQEALREQLEADGRPRLLLLTRECLAPVCADDLEDWVREPLDHDELECRGRTLEARARRRGLRPRVDEHGLIRVGERWVDLPPTQLPVARLLVARLDQVVHAGEIQATYVEAGGSIHPKAVKAMISRVKRRFSEVGLVLTNVRDRGYLLEAGPG